MAGKNKVNRWFTINVDDSGGTPRDLSADLVPGSCKGGGLVFDTAEMTGNSDAVKNYLADHANSEIDAQFYLNDTSTTGAFTVTKGVAGKVGTVTLDWGSGAAPTTGDPEWGGEYLLTTADIQPTGNRPIINCKFLPSGSVAPAWTTHA